MTEKYSVNDLLDAKGFADKHNLNIDDVKLAMQKLRGLMMNPPKGSLRRTKVPVIVTTGSRKGTPKVNYGADEIVITKVKSLQNNGK